MPVDRRGAAPRALLLALLALTLPGAEPPVPGPGGVPPRDLGVLTRTVTVLPGGSGTAAFPVAIPGASPFLIDRVERSCGCLTVLAPPRLLPGEATVIEVGVSAESRLGTWPTSLLLIGTQDGVPATVGLRILRQVDDLLAAGLEPWTTLQMGSVGVGRWASASRAYVRGGYPLPWDRVTAEVRPAGPDDGQWSVGFAPSSDGGGTLTAAALAPATIGPISASIHLAFWNDGKRLAHEGIVPVRAVVTGDWRAIPSECLFLAGDDAAPAASIALVGPPGRAWRIGQIRSTDGDRIQASSRSDPQGHQILALSLLPRPPAGPVHGAIEVEVVADRTYVVRIPYRGTVVP